ncbi:MAG TPA: D-alanyl-D-alanine carboxypeptidase, partial [Candidatus Nanopelagicales bacterium]|nr:D-alanyl-D-alanine carboxypeptidase [Candidatus Nanopelagicales bacterium]
MTALHLRVTVLITACLMPAGALLGAPPTLGADTMPPTPPTPAVAAPAAPWAAVEADSGTGPSAAGVIDQIDDLATATSLRRSGVVVVDPGTDAVLYDDKAQRALIPASSLKILTAAAALEALGSTTRLATTTAQAGDVVYLIGGGDATLARKDKRDSNVSGPATIRRLARESATALGGTTRVDVVFDD